MGDRGVFWHVVAGWMLVMALALAAGCGDSDDAPQATAKPASTTALDPATRTKLLATGKRIFDKQCSFCHRLNGIRAPRTPTPDAYGSSFDEIETSQAFVVERVSKGFGGMQSFNGALGSRQIRAVAMYVVANQGGDVDAPAPPQAQLTAGEQVFVDHCQRCHSIADRAQTGKPEETSAAWQATDFRVVRPSAAFVTSVLDGTGNAFMLELMPEVQGKLTQREIRDVAAYVNTLATPGPMVGSPHGAGVRQ